MLERFSEEILKNPYPLYGELRSSQPVFHDESRELWFLFEYDAVKRTLTDQDAFSSAVAGGQPAKWLLFTDPPRHSRLRALIGRAFTARAVAELEPRIRGLSRRLIDTALEGSEFDFVGELALPLPMMVIAEMLGAPAADWRLFRRWSDAMLGLIGTLSPGEEAERAERAFAEAADEMLALLSELLRARRATPADDLLTGLLQAEVDGERLSESDILGFFQLLLIAGHETTTNLLGNAILCWLEHPSSWDRVRQEPALLPTFVEEVLRYRSPVQAMFRIARRDVEFSNRVIPRGSLLLTMIGAANRDPKQFQAADHFDLARQPNSHLAFGHGIHFCVGAPLARLEARIALAECLRRFERLELAGAWQPRRAFHVHGPTRLPLRVMPSAR